MDKRAPERRLVVPRGRWGFVEYALRANGEYEAQNFLDDELFKTFGKSDGKKVRRRLIAILQNLSDYGESYRLEKKRNSIYGIKHEFMGKQIRLPCFMCGKCWVLTHGFFKPGAKKGRGPWPVWQLDRADKIMQEHMHLFRHSK